MKKFLFLLLFLPISGWSMCLEFYLDKDGQLHAVPCGQGGLMLNCGPEQYRDGEFCRDIEIIKSCKAQGGTWEQAQLRGADLADALNPDNLRNKKAIIHLCVCPNQTVWDGQNCRSDIPIQQQCTTFFGDGSIRITHDFFGPGECPRIP